MIDEKIIIDKKLIEIQDNILQILNPNYYKNKVQRIQSDTLSITVSGFAAQLSSDLLKLPQISYLEQQVADLINGLDEKFTETKFQNITSQLLSARLTGWSMIKGKLNEFQSILSKTLYEESTENDVSFDDVALLKDQVALLIIYLRDSKIISSSLSDIAVARCFHEMTGFSAEKLRQKISGIAKSEHNQITDLESNYDKLKVILLSIIDLIEDDKRKAILKKAK
jgi:hypothetical protein